MLWTLKEERHWRGTITIQPFLLIFSFGSWRHFKVRMRQLEIHRATEQKKDVRLELVENFQLLKETQED